VNLEDEKKYEEEVSEVNEVREVIKVKTKAGRCFNVA
jgi:hypothetical protein